METKIVKIGNKVIGGGNPILIQSMTNTKAGRLTITKVLVPWKTKTGRWYLRILTAESPVSKMDR